MEATAAASLRSLAHDALAKHLYGAAAFFADKLVAAAGAAPPAPADVYTLAQAFFVAREHRRCLHLLRSAGAVDLDLRFRYLAARCLAECREWEEALELLGGPDAESAAELGLGAPGPGAGKGGALDGLSAACALRGAAFDALENFPRAALWYKEALQIDAFNVEAFEALVGRHRIPVAEAAKLCLRLNTVLPESAAWLGAYYTARVGNPGDGFVEFALDALECEPWTAEEAATYEARFAAERAARRAAEAAAERTPPPAAAAAEQPVAMRTRRRSSPPPPPGGAGAGGAPASAPGSSGSRRSGRRSAAAAPAASAGGAEAMSTDTAAPAAPAPPAAELPPVRIRGWGLAASPDVAALRAEWLLRRGAAADAAALTRAALERDPFAPAPLPAHLAACVELRRRPELFALAHRLVAARPGAALSWLAAGAYYLAAGQPAAARRHLARATALDPGCAPAWVAYGAAFAAADESDQAMAAFRAGARRFPALPDPLLGVGAEHQRTANLALAEQALAAAYTLSPADPRVAHELGVLSFKAGRYGEAAEWLTRALALAGAVPTRAGSAEGALAAWRASAGGAPAPPAPPAFLEPCWANLGHALRRLRRFDDAAAALRAALGLAPGRAGTHAALGFTLHLAGDVDGAVESYHAALGLRPSDAFAAAMLSEALADGAAALELQLAEEEEAGAGGEGFGSEAGARGGAPF